MSTGAANRYDAIVVGAGHNGLVNACYLARAGLKVLVLERNSYIGGAAVSRSLYDGFTYSNCSYVCSLLRTEIIRALELPAHGLQIIPYEGGCTMMRDGGHLAVYDNHDAMRREIARHSRHDAEAYDRYVRDMLRHCRFIKPLLLREPPDPTSFRPRDLQELLFLGKHFHQLGEARMYDTLRFFTMSCADMLEEYFESEIVKAHLSGSSIIGTALGPRSPGSAYVLLHHYMGSIDGAVGAWGFARGGMGAITQALAASFKASGGTVRASAPVEQILVHSGHAAGVVLVGGRSSPRASWFRIWTLSAPSCRPWRRSTCRRSFSSRCASSRSAAPRASSTSPLMACRTFRPSRKVHPRHAVTCTSPTLWRWSSAPTMTGRRGAGRACHTSTC